MTPSHTTVGSSPIFLITDAGPDNDQSTVADGHNVVLDRTRQNTGGRKPIYWLALEQNLPVSQMKRVVWKALPYYDGSVMQPAQGIWVSIASDNHRWDPARQKFVDRLTASEL